MEYGICKNLKMWKMGRMLQELASEYWLVLLPVSKCTFKLKLSNQIVDKSLYSQPFDCWWVICKMCSSWFMGSWFTMHSDCELMTSTCEMIFATVETLLQYYVYILWLLSRLWGNLVIVSLTSYYISHAGNTGNSWYRMAYDFMLNICFHMRLNGYTGSVNCSPCLQIGLLFSLEEIGFFTGRNIRTYLAYGISVCAGVLGLCASPSNSKMACTL